MALRRHVIGWGGYFSNVIVPEMLLSHADLFEPVELKHRVFTKVWRLHSREQLIKLRQGVGQEQNVSMRLGQQRRLREAALDATTDAILVIHAHGTLVDSNQKARDFRAAHRRPRPPLPGL